MRFKSSFWVALLVGFFGVAPVALAQDDYPAQQGWGQSQMRAWYELSQGSRLIPLAWLKALKNSDGTLFFERKTMEAFGYNYFSDKSASLPIGFIVDRDQNKEWMGFNCSACHTAKLKTGSVSVFVHGGQTMADFQAFTTDLIANMARVFGDDKNFAAFSQEVLGQAATDPQKAGLKIEIAEWLDHRKRINDTGNDSHWGRGRADAVGIIMATTASVVADPTIPQDQREPFPASNAPVSFPFVWNANQQARLQHNGVVDNGTNFGVVRVAKIGALIRNWTEALGVFADVKLDAQGQNITTSIRLDNLLKIEQALADLQSPRWPDTFGKLDQARMARGEGLYKNNCGSCHGLLSSTDTTTSLPLLEQPSTQNSTDPKGFIYLQPVFDKRTTPAAFAKSIAPSPKFIGTDPMMACNALMHRVPSGKFEGQKNVKGYMPSGSDGNFADHAATTDLLRVLIQRDVMAHKADSLLMFADNQLAAAGEMLTRYAYAEYQNDFGAQSINSDKLGPLRAALQNCADYLQTARVFAPDTPLPVYKARPLNGIWATAPYLHNGSVPTLYDLLLPQIKRPKAFGYFDGEMDLKKAGLKDASANPAAFIFQAYDKDGFVIPGNWNGGHDYGTGLNEQDRLDLLEYLKGL
jgi:hypothetical protein